MAENAQPDETKKVGKSMMSRLLIAGFIGAVIGSECLFAYFWLPSAEELAERTKQIVEEAEESTKQEKSTTKAVSVVEVDLEDFDITNHRLPTESTFRINFHLWGTIAEADRKEFADIYNRNKHRFRDQVLVEIRDSEITDLEDAGLGLIKRRILEKSNALFGKTLLRSVGFDNYTFVEL